MISQVLVPLDGSPLAESTLPHALALAAAFGAELQLFRVVGPGRIGGLSEDSLEKRLQRREAGAYLDRLAAELRASGATVSVDIGEGKATEQILRRVAEGDIDLILLSAWGRGGRSELILGGTARKLIAGAHTSIMLIRPRKQPSEQRKAARYGRIFVPVDGSRRADWALCLAAAIAREQEAEMIVMHVVSAPETAGRLPRQPLEQRLREELVKVSRRSAEQYLEGVRHRMQAPGLALRSMVVVGTRVPDELLRAARRARAGLIVMSAHGASDDVLWPYGSVAASLLDYCDLPLLVLQDRPRAAHPKEPGAVSARVTRSAVHVPAR